MRKLLPLEKFARLGGLVKHSTVLPRRDETHAGLDVQPRTQVTVQPSERQAARCTCAPPWLVV